MSQSPSDDKLKFGFRITINVKTKKWIALKQEGFQKRQIGFMSF